MATKSSGDDGARNASPDEQRRTADGPPAGAADGPPVREDAAPGGGTDGDAGPFAPRPEATRGEDLAAATGDTGEPRAPQPVATDPGDAAAAPQRPAHDAESAPWAGPSAWIFPGFVALIGLVAVWGAVTIEAPPNSAPPGPGVVPGVIGGLLLLTAAIMALGNLRVSREIRNGAMTPPVPPPTEWSPVLLTLGSIGAHIALLESLGWLLAGTLLFWGVSYAFGARSPLRDGLVALTMSAAVQVGFSFGLGLSLPGGVLELVL